MGLPQLQCQRHRALLAFTREFRDRHSVEFEDEIIPVRAGHGLASVKLFFPQGKQFGGEII